jgi:hypothetical protein
MFAFLIPLVGAKFAKPVGYALIALAVALFFFGAKAIYDHNVVSHYKDKVEASQAKADRKADQNAAQAEKYDVSRQNQEADELIKVQDNAKNEQDRRLAFHRCLRLQQRARDNGLKPPACI